MTLSPRTMGSTRRTHSAFSRTTRRPEALSGTTKAVQAMPPALGGGRGTKRALTTKRRAALETLTAAESLSSRSALTTETTHRSRAAGHHHSHGW